MLSLAKPVCHEFFPLSQMRHLSTLPVPKVILTVGRPFHLSLLILLVVGIEIAFSAPVTAFGGDRFGVFSLTGNRKQLRFNSRNTEEWNQAYEISDSKNPLKWRSYKRSLVLSLYPAVSGRNCWPSGWKIISPSSESLPSHQNDLTLNDALLPLRVSRKGPPLLPHQGLDVYIHIVCSYATVLISDWLLLLYLLLKVKRRQGKYISNMLCVAEDVRCSINFRKNRSC